MNTKVRDIPKTLIELWGYEANTPEHEARFWAWEATNQFVYDNPKQAWEVIIQVLELTKSDIIIECLGASFLEHLMCEADELTMKLITAELPNNGKLNQCMSSVLLRCSDTPLYTTFYDLIGLEPPFGDEP